MKNVIVLVVALLIPWASYAEGSSTEALWQENLRIQAKECRETPMDNPFRNLICGKENRHLPADRVPAEQEEAPKTGSQIYKDAIGKDPY